VGDAVGETVGEDVVGAGVTALHTSCLWLEWPDA
jgi:hypothetical protein